jgi:hypothetical protein
MATKCNIVAQINRNALKLFGDTTVDSIKKSVLTKDQVIEYVKNTSDIIGSDTYEQEVEDRGLLVKALDKIKAFEQYGITIPIAYNALHEAASRFFNNVIRHTDQVADFINTLDISGNYSGTINPIVEKNNKGEFTSTKTAKELNTYVRNFLSKRLLVENKTYVTKNSKGIVKFNQSLAEDYNTYIYNRYQVMLAVFADTAVEEDKNTPDDYKGEISYLRTTPVISHAKAQLRSLNNRLKVLKNLSSYDPVKVAMLNVEVSKQQDKIKVFNKVLEFDQLQSYFEEALTNVKDDLDSGQILDEVTLEAHLKTIKLVQGAADSDPIKNSVLEFSEFKSEEMLPSMKQYGIRADDLEVRLKNSIFATLADSTRSRFSKAIISDEQLNTVYSLKNAFQRAVSNLLGIHHIDNPIIQWMYSIISEKEVIANDIARREGDEIEKLYKEMLSSGNISPDKFVQEDGDRMVDVFSTKWWKNVRKIANNKALRDRQTIPLNPITLDPKNNSPEKKKLVDFMYEHMGKYTADQRIAKALSQWEAYKQALSALEESDMSKQDLKAWIENNSPIERMRNFQRGKGQGNPGTDNFLLLIPKKYDTLGRDLGFYDDTFKEIDNDESASKFYRHVRKIFTRNELELHNFEEEFKPPKVAFLGKSVAEHVKNSDWEAASKLFLLDLKNRYSLKGSLNLNQIAKDPITGRPQGNVSMEVHSVYDEFLLRYKYFLENNAEFKLLTDKTEEERDRKAEIMKEAQARIKSEVNLERSTDLLQAVVMANYATHSFIQKRMVETQANLVQHLVEDGRITTSINRKLNKEKPDLKDISHLKLENLIKNYIDVALYDKNTNEQTASIGVNEDFDINQKDKKGFTGERLSRVLQDVGRVVYLGYSPVLSFLNLGQQHFSNLMKAAEGSDFNFRELYSGIGSYLTNKKDRNLIDRLFIFGDLAYNWEKRSIHEQSKLWAKAHPMFLQTETEKVNQGSTSIAILKHQRVFRVNKKGVQTGEELSLYEALDEEGLLGDQYRHKEYGDSSGIDLLAQITVDKIRPVVQKTAGDYLSPLTIQNTEWGKFAIMFKKYLPEMLADRFHKRKFDYALNRETIGRINALGVVLNKIRRGDKVDAVELKAFKAGAFEVALVIIVRGLFMLFAANSCDTPQCKEQSQTRIMALNLMGRLSDDIMGFLNPYRMAQQVFRPFAVEGIITDFVKFFWDDLGSAILPGGDTGRYRSETDYAEKGDLRFLQSGQRMLPFWGVNGYKAKRLTKQIRYDPTITGFIRSDLQE